MNIQLPHAEVERLWHIEIKTYCELCPVLRLLNMSWVTRAGGGGHCPTQPSWAWHWHHTSLERLQQTYSDSELDRVSQWAAVSPRGATKWGRVGDGGLIFPSLLGSRVQLTVQKWLLCYGHWTLGMIYRYKMDSSKIHSHCCRKKVPTSKSFWGKIVFLVSCPSVYQFFCHSLLVLS